MITSAQARVQFTRRHVDQAGFVTRDGQLAVWQAVAGLPDGARVFLDLGPTRHVSQPVLNICADHLGAASELILEGPRPDVVAAWLAAARAGAQ